MKQKKRKILCIIYGPVNWGVYCEEEAVAICLSLTAAL